LLLALPAPAATRAVAASPCWVTLLNDWYGGRIDKVYPIHCYQDTINHLPKDIEQYSSAREDIQRALGLAIAYKKNPSAPKPTITSSHLPDVASPGIGTTGRAGPSGIIPNAIGNSSSGGATSFPLPLIILGGLAIFLLAAGGIGLIVRRMQDRGGPGPA
jgi:hypothetical protein